MTLQEINELKRLLRQLQKVDVDGRVSGVKHYKYGWGPTWDENDLSAFEQQHSIKLPEDYRFFLREAGDGGSGPYHGIQTLKSASRGRDLSVPFPYTKSTSVEWPGDEPAGVLELCNQGCGYYFWLIVNGPAYGTIWNYWHHNNTWQPTGLTFGAFYIRWINQLKKKILPRLENEKVISKIKVGMTKEEVIAICGGRNQVAKRGMKILQFDHLSTEFLLDDKDVVERIIYHNIFWPLV